MPSTAKLTEVFFTGAWLAVMVNDAAPPWVIEAELAVRVSIGTTVELIVTVADLGLPTV